VFFELFSILPLITLIMPILTDPKKLMTVETQHCCVSLLPPKRTPLP
jgi:hypothetical protein